MKDIGRRAAHVKPHHRLQRQTGVLQRLMGHSDRPHHAAGRTRKNRVLGLQPGPRRQGAAGTHDPQWHAISKGLLHLIEVPR
jgi:hypothetical protein